MRTLNRIPELFKYWQLKPSATQLMSDVVVAEHYEAVLSYYISLKGRFESRADGFVERNSDLFF